MDVKFQDNFDMIDMIDRKTIICEAIMLKKCRLKTT